MSIRSHSQSISKRLSELTAALGTPRLVSVGIRSHDNQLFPFVLADFDLVDEQGGAIAPILIHSDKPVPAYALNDPAFVKRMEEALFQLAPRIHPLECRAICEALKEVKNENNY